MLVVGGGLAVGNQRGPGWPEQRICIIGIIGPGCCNICVDLEQDEKFISTGSIQAASEEHTYFLRTRLKSITESSHFCEERYHFVVNNPFFALCEERHHYWSCVECMLLYLRILAGFPFMLYVCVPDLNSL